jgi:hypothetical protein
MLSALGTLVDIDSKISDLVDRALLVRVFRKVSKR